MDINEYLKQILQRLDKLEQRINFLEKKERPEKTEAVESLGDLIEKKEVLEIPAESKTILSPSFKKEPQRQTISTFSETNIVKNWFNKIGALSLVMGLVFFISYTFQYIGPAGKIVIGYVAGLALLGLGFFLNKKYKNYSQIILAIGWAAIYFTTFATYHIKASQIIYNFNVNLILLFLVVGAMTAFSLIYNSEYFTIAAFSLGYLTAIISRTPFISLTATLLLLVAIITIILWRNWSNLAIFAVVVNYLTYWTSLIKQDEFFSYSTFKIGSVFLILYFTGFVIASLFIKSQRYKDSELKPPIVIINTFSFFVLFLSQLYNFYPDKDGIFSALLGLVLLSIALGVYFFKKEERSLYLAYGWLGWGLLTLSVPLHFVGHWIGGSWLVGGASLLIIGLIKNKKSLRSAGFITLTLFLLRFLSYDLLQKEPIKFLGLNLTERFLLTLFTVFVFAVINIVWEKFKKDVPEEENKIIFLPSLIAIFISILLINLEFSRSFIGFAWLVEGGIVYLIGLLVNKPYLRKVSLILMVLFFFRWMSYDVLNKALIFPGTEIDFNFRTYISLSGIIIFSLLYILSELFKEYLSKEESIFLSIFPSTATFLLVFITALEVNNKLISVYWGIEGLAIMVLGFLTRKRILRWLGLIVLLLTILRVFLIDLSFLERVYRIISFIVLGVILLGISFIYTKYKDKLEKYF